MELKYKNYTVKEYGDILIKLLLDEKNHRIIGSAYDKYSGTSYVTLALERPPKRITSVKLKESWRIAGLQPVTGVAFLSIDDKRLNMGSQFHGGMIAEINAVIAFVNRMITIVGQWEVNPYKGADKKANKEVIEYHSFFYNTLKYVKRQLYKVKYSNNAKYIKDKIAWDKIHKS